VRATSAKFKIEYEDVVRVFHRGRLIIWVPTVRGETVVMADRRIGKFAAQLLKGEPEVQGIGVGLLASAAAGWAASADEACKAIEFGLRNSPLRSVHLYSDIAINESARRNENVLRYLNSLLERLADEPELLTTLQSYFDNQLRRKLTAETLGIHPNTLNNRLERVEALLGADLADVGWIAKLHILVKLRR
jgi:sugar diacid utilization regulator